MTRGAQSPSGRRCLLPTPRLRTQDIPALFFRSPDKPILDLGVDLMEPFFSTVGSFLMKPNFGL